MGAAIIAGVDAAPVLEPAEHVLDLVPAAVECGVVKVWCLPVSRGHPTGSTTPSVFRRSPDATLEDFKDRASFASARYRQPGATRSFDMLSGHPSEIIR
jgi:hypothetical protein